jgi:hypothetical protein
VTQEEYGLLPRAARTGAPAILTGSDNTRFEPGSMSRFLISEQEHTFHHRRICGVPRIPLVGGGRGLFLVVKQDVRRRRLHAKVPQHGDNLAAV